MKIEHGNVLIFIVKYMKEKEHPPTTKGICHGTRYQSIASVNTHLKAMRDAGLINYVDRGPRIITVTGYQCVKKNTNKEEIIWR